MSDMKYDSLCPICGKAAMPYSLRIDKYVVLLDIINTWIKAELDLIFRFFSDILSITTDQSFDEIIIRSDYSRIPSKRKRN